MTYNFKVVEESTVCLMKHEHRKTLSMIEDMAFMVYRPTPYYPLQEPSEDLNLLSPAELPYNESFSSAMSMSMSSSSSSTSSLSLSSSKNSLGMTLRLHVQRVL